MNRVIPCVTALSLLTPLPSSAQDHPELAAAVQLATEGRGDSARTLVRRILDVTSPIDSLYPEALYTMGVVANNATEALLAFRRVVIEYGLSPWADDALLRLVHLTYPGGDPAATITWFERLHRDYPFSPLLAEAILWGARAYFDLRDEVKGCELLNEGLATVGDDIETERRLAFYAQRCDTVRAPQDSAPPQTTRQFFAVQVLAVNSVPLADRMLTRLRQAGFQATVLRDADGLLKVRVGRYSTRAEAMRTAARIKRRGIADQPFVVEVTP